MALFLSPDSCGCSSGTDTPLRTSGCECDDSATGSRVASEPVGGGKWPQWLKEKDGCRPHYICLPLASTDTRCCTAGSDEIPLPSELEDSVSANNFENSDPLRPAVKAELPNQPKTRSTTESCMYRPIKGSSCVVTFRNLRRLRYRKNASIRQVARAVVAATMTATAPILRPG